MLREFIFPSLDFSTSSKALMGCETYCLIDQKCWGCSIHCSTPEKCQYNAIPNCGELQNWAGLMEGDVTQKPGKL